VIPEMKRQAGSQILTAFAANSTLMVGYSSTFALNNEGRKASRGTVAQDALLEHLSTILYLR